MYKSVFVIFFFTLGWTVFLFCQGPVTGFMPKKKGTDIAMTYSYESFEEYFFGDKKSQISSQIRSINLFIEHGITDSLSLVVNLPYLWADEFNKGLQDATIFVKYKSRFKRYSIGTLTQITVVGISLPVWKYPILTENPIGQRNTILQGRFVAQYQSNFGLFIHLQGGVDFQISPNNQTAIPIIARMGWGSSKVYVDAWLEYYHAFQSGKDLQILGGQGSRWLKAGGVFYYGINQQFGIFIGGAQILNGRNVGQSTRLNTGIVYKWKRK